MAIDDLTIEHHDALSWLIENGGEGILAPWHPCLLASGEYSPFLREVYLDLLARGRLERFGIDGLRVVAAKP